MLKNLTIAVSMELHKPYRRHYGIFAGIQKFAESKATWKLEPVNYPETEISGARRFDGIIGRITNSCYMAAVNAGIPLVNVMQDSPVALELSGSYLDFRAAGRMAAEHLIARGLRNLVSLGYTRSASTSKFNEGFKEVAKEHGCPCELHSYSLRFDETRDHWSHFVERTKFHQECWDAPVGVACVDDVLCRSIATVCESIGWRVPDDLALIGIGNDPLICTAIDPTLSTIDMGSHQCGFEAAKLLDELLQNGVGNPEQVYTPPKELIVGRSSDAFVVSDPLVARALRFMLENAGESLSVPKIAASVGMGRQSLERRFQRHVGRTINDELIRLRVNKMRRLLVESSEPIKRLSPQAGFGTNVSMHTMFRRLTGLTPKAYREKHAPRIVRNELLP